MTGTADSEESPAGRPRLLVSVRDAGEARAANAGGTDVIDVKEPLRGSLGRADVATIADVVSVVRECGPSLPGSGALGETREWLAIEKTAIGTGRGGWGRAGGEPLVGPQLRLPRGLAYAKLGLSGLADRADWRRDWLDVRCRIESSAESHFGWIAVAYADWKAAGAPPPADVIAAAIETGCAGMLVDTFGKSGRTTLDRLPSDELSAIGDRVRSAGLQFALAGGLRREQFAQVAEIGPDIVAVRGAACGGHDRTGRVSVDAVGQLAATLRRCSAGVTSV